MGERLKLSNAENTELVQLTAPNPRIWLGMPRVALDAALYQSGRDLVLSRMVLAVAHGRQLGGWAPMASTVRQWSAKPLPISGDDVVALGIAPGPAVGAALKKAESAWIGSGFTASRDQLLAATKETAPGGGSGAV